MHTHKITNKKGLLAERRGQSIIEIIVAVGIFTMIAASVVVLYLGSHSTTLRDTEKLQADMYLQQGFEAVRSIRDFNFAGLTNGTHGLSNASGYWQFSGSSDILGQFTRTTVVEAVQRNSSCAIVTSGGTTDNNSKKVTVSINWDYEAGNSTSLSAVEYLNKWTNQAGCGQASYFYVDVSSAVLAGGDKKLEGITIQNIGPSSIVIDTILPTWTNSNLIKEVKIDGTRIWKDNGEGTPDGQQASGVELDNDDFTLTSGSGVLAIDKFDFSASMSGASFTFLFTMTDGTTRYIEVTPGAPPADTTAPASIIDLSASNPTALTIDLDWTAPGDDGSTGTATTYDVRYSTSTITTGNWASATQATGEPTPSVAGSPESMTISGLTDSTTYYFAIKTSDEVPNESSISNVPNDTTLSAGTQADNLTIDTSGANIAGGGDKELRGITVENTGGTNITIAKITVTWTNGQLIEEIKIEGTRIWKHNNEGSPDGRQSTGTEIDVVDYTITTGSTDVFDKFKFNGDMSGDTFTILFEMGDGSTKSVTGLTPADG